jgi:hypothetical protein
MAFIGNTNTTQAFTPAVDYFSGNGSTTAFTLSRPVASVAQVQVVIDNVAQNPSSAYTVSANTITFTSAPLSGTNNIYVYYTSPITQVIAPGQGTVTTTSLTSGFTLPVASGGTGLTTVPHTVQVFTSGSGTYTLPTNCKAIWVRMAGGGGGGGQNSSTGGTNGAGGTTTFGSSFLTCTGGGGSAAGGGTIGAGGTATGGDINISGGNGQTGFYNGLAAGGIPGGGGGTNPFGGSGGSSYNAGATSVPANTGAGGGGADAPTYNVSSGNGGGAGAYLEKMINSPSATYSYAVGAVGGTGSGGGAQPRAGAAGIIIVTEYYV